MSDLRESGSIEQDADVVIFLHDPRAYDENQPEGIVEAIVAKHRGGKRGIVRVGWRPEYTKFHDAMEGSIYD